MRHIVTLTFLYIFFAVNANVAWGQRGSVSGKVTSQGEPVAAASVEISGTGYGMTTDTGGNFVIKNIPKGVYKLQVTVIGYDKFEKTITVRNEEVVALQIALASIKATLNEVVVTGVPRTTLIRENPLSIVAVSTKAIERTNETNIIDVLVKNVPGLNAVKTGPNISKPFIRGLGYNRVLTLYDGMRQEGQQWGDEHGIEVDAYNIEKGEVLKGPASLMYGSDALAGVVSLLPATPHEADGKIHGRVLAEYQTNNGLAGNGFRLAYANTHWAYALRGSYRIAKNYTNQIDGRVYNTGFCETNASALVKYTGNKGHADINLTLYDNLQGIPDGTRDSLSRKFTRQVYEGNLDDLATRPIVSDAMLNTYQLSPLHQHIQHYRIYSNAHYELGKGDVDFLLGFQQNVRREFNHPTAPKQAGLYVRLNTLNYGIRYNAPLILNTEVTIGINGMYQNNASKNATDFPVPDYNLLDAGGFLFAKWKLNKWTLSGGVRSDIRRLTGDDFYTATNPVNGFGRHVSLPDTASAFLQFARFNKLFKGLSLSIGATYKLSDKISLKANVARGYRAPSITEFASNGLDPGAHIIYLGNRNFSPEFSVQEDLGADANFKNISASVSLFNSHISNYIYLFQLSDGNGNAVVDAQGNKTYQYQQDKAQLYGLEAVVSLHPKTIKGFSFDNAFSVVNGYNRKKDYKNEAVNGEYLPLIPPAKLISSISQEVYTRSKLFSLFNIKAEMNYSAAQNHYLGLNNTETATPGFRLFDFSCGAQLNYSKDNTLQIQLQVNNAFDKTYQSNLSRLKYFEYYSKSPNGHLGMYNIGRNVCLKMVLPF